MDEKLVEAVKEHFDLNTYEAKVWVALLARGIASAGELAELTGVPRSRAYDILESLEKKGLVILKLGKPIKYIAVNPEEVIEKLKKRVDLELFERKKRIEEIKNTPIWQELRSLYESGIKKIDPTQISGAIRGRHHLHDRMEELIEEAEKEIILATTGKEFNRIVDYHYHSFKAAKDRGVKIYIAVKPEGVDEKALRLAKEFAEVRDAKDLNSRMLIVDGREVIFMLTSEEEVHPSYDTGVWVHSPFFARSMREMFFRAWEKMKPL